MKSVIAFRDGRRVSLAGAIDPELYAELERTHSPRKDPVLFCGGCGGGIYLRHGIVRRDELFGAHHEAGDCAQTFTVCPSTMSDEHKRMAEYHVLAARAEGLDADMEIATSGRTRVDVVVDGRIGFEVQRSALTARAAVDRTARSIAAGLESVAWCGLMRAPWTGKVPGYQWLDVDRVLCEMPPRRSVRSRGLATFRAERGHLGRWEAQLEPLTVLVDDAVVRMADGSIRPVLFGKYARLVRADGIALYEEITGTQLTPFNPGRPITRALAPAAEVACIRPPAAAPSAPGVASCIWCRQPFDQEAIRFKLTIHPRCADERAELKAQYRQTSDSGVALCPGSVSTTRFTATPRSLRLGMRQSAYTSAVAHTALSI